MSRNRASIFILALASAVPGPTRAMQDVRPDRDLSRVQAAFRDASRRLLEVTGETYSLGIDLDTGTLRTFAPSGAPDGAPEGGANVLREPGISFEAVSQGKPWTPRAGTGRINIYSFGPVMYDVHIRDLELVDAHGNVLPVMPDVAVRAYGDRVHVEFSVTGRAPVAIDEIRLRIPAEATVASVDGLPEARWVGAEGPGLLVVSPPGSTGESATETDGAAITELRRLDHALERGTSASVHVALFPADNVTKGQRQGRAETPGLAASAFTVGNGSYEGFDRGRGCHSIRTSFTGPRHFEAAHANPNSRVRTDLRIENDDRARTLYLRVHNTYGTLEATVLADKHGVPLPVQVQTGKNFGGEKEEGELEGDHAFGESIIRLELEPGEVFEGRVLHLFGNWGSHALKQISSIRFFRHYFHASIGPTETICYVPFPYPRDDNVTYSLADVRALSTPMWPGQPQHDHVSIIGYLRYQTSDGWVHPRLIRTSIYHTGPNFARMAMQYRTEDERARARLEFFELPQADETRCFTRIRYDFDQAPPLAGPPCETVRFVNSGAYIVRTVHDKVTWIDADGARRTADIPPDGSLVLRGEPLSRDTPFAASYRHKRGNILFLVRSWSARLGGRDAPPAVTVQGHEDLTEMFLTAPADVERLMPGDFVDAEVVVIPYGDGGATDDTPAYERQHYGADGPRLEVLRGEAIESFPWRVRVDDRGAAEVKVSGGLDHQVLIVEGLSDRRWPMLWEQHGGWLFVDPQVEGNDGGHLYRCPDGSVGAVFVVHTRPGQTHHYLVCEPPDRGTIVSVRSRNGRVTVTYEDGAAEVLDAPPNR